MHDSSSSSGSDAIAEAPILIWTFRRTGGTSLRGILFWLTKRGSFQDEAFNDDPERELGSITQAFRKTGDDVLLRLSIRNALDSARNLKHCIDAVPFRLSSVLLDEALSRGYRNVILLRLNEVDRQISLDMARRTGAWGPDEARVLYQAVREGRRSLPPLNVQLMRVQAEADAALLGKLIRLFMTARQEPNIVFFEDLYTGDVATRYQAFRKLAVSVGIPNAHNLADEVFRTAAVDSSQGSASMFSYLSNYDDAVAVLKQIVR